MKKLTGSLLAAFLAFGGAAVVATTTASAAPVPTTGGGTPNWQSLEQTALGVTAGARGSGPLNLAGLPSPVTQSTVTTPSGPVSLSQQTVVSTDRSGVVVINTALLGGRQEIISEVSPADNYQGETLVLAPGSSTVTGTYHLAGVRPATAQTSALHAAGHRSRKGGVVTASDGVYHPAGSGSATLTAAGGCGAYPQNPGVIGSIYGTLIQSTGIIDCSLAGETLAEIVGIYRNGTQIGSASGSGWGGYLGINAYAPCYSSYAHSFQTAELWAVNGSLAGADSGWSSLGCS
ncbi:MAG TPA: hypothetical protein VHW47_00975 [Acidimicrobiales bacterium]|nr:hypothetical protein [Acidimicrobiales bacterium]